MGHLRITSFVNHIHYALFPSYSTIVKNHKEAILPGSGNSICVNLRNLRIMLLYHLRITWLEHVLKNLEPSRYIMAINDALEYFQQRTTDLDGTCSCAYWAPYQKAKAGSHDQPRA